MGLRYGLLAALTLVLASALLWDRLHPPAGNRLFPRDGPEREDLAVVVVGGSPRSEPLPVSRPDGAASPSFPAEDAAGDPPAPGELEVVEGDTLSGIAQRTLGSARKAADLARHNGIRLDAPLRVGQVLRIPSAPAVVDPPSPAPPAAAAPGTHTVAPGDTLYSLARRYYGDAKGFARIAEANGLDPDEPLRAGRPLRIP